MQEEKRLAEVRYRPYDRYLDGNRRPEPLSVRAATFAPTHSMNEVYKLYCVVG